MQRILRFLRGYVKIRINGYSPERFLNLCSHHQIDIWGLQPCKNSYEMYVKLKDFRKIRPIVRKTRTKVVLVERFGMPFFLTRCRSRTWFLAGAVLCMLLLMFYTSFIWDIHFEGNEKWTDEVLLQFLEQEKITPAMPKGKVDCADIVRKIRQKYDDIVWVSASIDGSRLKIQIKENEDTFQEVQKEEKPCDLIAEQDGVITKMVTRSGVPMVHVGDQVKKGDILVSGRIEVCNDAKEVVEYQYEQADADIRADTQTEYEDEISTYYEEKRCQNQKRMQVFVEFKNWECHLGSVKNSFPKSEQYVMKRQVTLGENFHLPLFYGVKVAKSYQIKEKRYTNEEIQKKLSENFKQFSKELKEKGIQIQENSVKIHIGKKSAVAKGSLYLNEDIAKKADTEILEIERNKKDESFRTDD